MMKKFSLKRVGILLITLISILAILVSCSTREVSRTTENQTEELETQQELNDTTEESTEVSLEEQESTEQEKNVNAEWKTDEIFDPSNFSDKLTVRFFNTRISVEGSSEGDLILITTPDEVTMLIDAGMPECGPVLVEYLDKLNIEKLDYAVGTHMHIDHIGGYIDILNNIDVNQMIFPNFTNYNTSIAKGLLATLDTKKIPTKIVKEGEKFKLGQYVDIEILAPEWDITIPDGTVPEKSAGFINNHSLVMRMTYDNNTFLFPADIYWEREDILVSEQEEKLNVDVLKVPHHGSHTSSSIKFVNAVEPEVAVITSISPDKEVYDRYKRKGSDMYITGLDGNILVISDGNNIDVIQEHERTIQGYYD
jgi:competence protein ComEC